MNNNELRLDEIHINGKKYNLTLMDGSKWLIKPSDLPTVITWISTAKIKIEKSNEDSMFSYKLINLSENTYVFAQKVSQLSGDFKRGERR